MVLAELLAALSKVPVRPYAIGGVDRIRANPNVEVVPQTSIQFANAYGLYRSRPDKEWSLTDCASFELMRERGLTDALAHDVHFEQAGFVALLRDPVTRHSRGVARGGRGQVLPFATPSPTMLNVLPAAHQFPWRCISSHRTR